MSVWWKIGAVAVAAAAFFMGGYKYAAALYEEDIASMIADYERRAKTVQENANAKLLSEREKNAQTTSELVAQIEDLSVRSRGCNATLPLDQKCPEPNPIPAELAKSDAQNAKNYSAKVSDWFKRVENYLKVYPSEKMQ